MKQVSNENGLKLDLVRVDTIGSGIDPQKLLPLLDGGLESLSWDEYLDDFTEEFQPHVLLMKKCIEENNLVGAKADKMASDWCFKSSDGYIFSLSWKAWGDFMQAVVNKKEGYMAYYR